MFLVRYCCTPWVYLNSQCSFSHTPDCVKLSTTQQFSCMKNEDGHTRSLSRSICLHNSQDKLLCIICLKVGQYFNTSKCQYSLNCAHGAGFDPFCIILVHCSLSCCYSLDLMGLPNLLLFHKALLMLFFILIKFFLKQITCNATHNILDYITKMIPWGAKTLTTPGPLHIRHATKVKLKIRLQTRYEKLTKKEN